MLSKLSDHSHSYRKPLFSPSVAAGAERRGVESPRALGPVLFVRAAPGMKQGPQRGRAGPWGISLCDLEGQREGTRWRTGGKEAEGQTHKVGSASRWAPDQVWGGCPHSQQEIGGSIRCLDVSWTVDRRVLLPQFVHQPLHLNRQPLAHPKCVYVRVCTCVYVAPR